jgi:hypothetical protein
VPAVSYALENALYNWEEGDRRLRDAGDSERRRLERESDEVVDELRRRLGSTFTLGELADLYGAGTDWARYDSSAVDAAFLRYSREAADYSGKRHPPPDR